MGTMTDREPPFLHGAMILLDESHRTTEALFARFDRAEDARERRRLAEAALHELKVHAAIEELVLPDAVAPEVLVTEKEPRRHMLRLIAELEAMTGGEKRHDAKFALLRENFRRHILREEALFPSAARGDGPEPVRPRGYSYPGPRPLTLLGFEDRLGAEAAERPLAGSNSVLTRNPALRDGGLVTKIGTGLRHAAAVAAGAMLMGWAANARAQSNQGGGVQLNPNTSLNSIISGGGTGAATPIERVVVPVTPASVPGPASSGKDRPAKKLPAASPPKKKRLSDRKLAQKVRGGIAHDPTLPSGSRNVAVAVAGGKVTLTGMVLSENDKYKIAARAAELAGVENVANLIEVKPSAPPP
jgi:hypothetical protein